MASRQRRRPATPRSAPSLPGALAAAARLALAGLLAAFLLGAVYREEAARQALRNRYLYVPRDWRILTLLDRGAAPQVQAAEPEAGGSVGGGSVGPLPLDIKRYRVKRGDTLSQIAERFGLDLDTVASLNREWGSGVHLLSVGEEIRIPNQDGIFLAVKSSLESLCEQKGVPAEVVRQVNHLPAGDVPRGTELFFPGVQHTGVERSVMVGTAFFRPVRGWLSSGFGYRKDPFSQRIEFHRGIDIAAPMGSPVRAAGDGLVTVVSRDPILGLHIVIRHPVGYSSVYGHLSQAMVGRGATVRRGQRIGSVGTSGKSTGPHLHFELRRGGRPVDSAGLIIGIH